jgi:hypothetical protein
MKTKNEQNKMARVVRTKRHIGPPPKGPGRSPSPKDKSLSGASSAAYLQNRSPPRLSNLTGHGTQPAPLPRPQTNLTRNVERFPMSNFRWCPTPEISQLLQRAWHTYIVTPAKHRNRFRAKTLQTGMHRLPVRPGPLTGTYRYDQGEVLQKEAR